MSLVRRESNTPVRYRDPFAMARDLFAWDLFGDQRPAVNFAPSFEVKETPETYVVKADMPGVKEDNLDVSLHNGVLAISGNRAAEERKEGETYFLYERQYGAFTRSFSLPETADPDRVEAKLDSGVLTVTIGKRAEAKPKRIALRK